MIVVLYILYPCFEASLTDVQKHSAVLQCFCIGSAGGDICRLQDLKIDCSRKFVGMRRENEVEIPTMFTSLIL